MKILRIFIFFILAATSAPGALPAENAFRRAAESERIIFSVQEYFNYERLLRDAGAPSLPAISPEDILLEPRGADGLMLHPDLLERMYRENMRRVFFIVELSPYYPPQKYDRLPWGSDRNYSYFGNAFWRNPGGISDIYRRVYGTAAEDFNSRMRRVERYREMDEKPRVFVFARLQRTGANSQWRNAWGWDYYYYFEGERLYMP